STDSYDSVVITLIDHNCTRYDFIRLAPVFVCYLSDGFRRRCIDPSTAGDPDSKCLSTKLFPDGKYRKRSI
ncbi:hypothetical protein GCK32_021638, partial [Trichostrongylus colubriformis]